MNQEKETQNKDLLQMKTDATNGDIKQESLLKRRQI